MQLAPFSTRGQSAAAALVATLAAVAGSAPATAQSGSGQYPAAQNPGSQKAGGGQNPDHRPSATIQPKPPAQPQPADKSVPPGPQKSAPLAVPKAPAGPVGVWIDDTGKGAIEIKPCGANLCGNIVWLAQPLGADGQPQNDGYNPDKSKRQQRVCGLQVIGDVKPQADGTWDAGWVYDPKVGKSFDVAFALEAKDRLKVTGYKGVKLFSKSFVWTRATAPLPRCDGAVTGLPPSPAIVPSGSAAIGAAPAPVAKPLPPAAARATVPTLQPASRP